MEINNNLVVNNPSVANAGGEGKTGLQRVTEAIESGNKIRQALSGEGTDGASEAGLTGGGSDMSEIIESIKEMIKMLEKQIEAMLKEMKDIEDPAMLQAMQAQVATLQSQVSKLTAQLLELGGFDFEV